MRYVKTSEGFVVNEETGEVVDVDNIDVEHPEYRVFDSEDMARKAHYAPMYRPIDSILSLGDLPPGIALLRRCDREGEEKALEIGGVRGLVILKCLKNMGCDTYTALYAVEKAINGVEGSGRWVKLAKQLLTCISEAESSALVRWAIYPSRPIDLSMVPGERRRTRYGLAVFLDIEGVRVQVMRNKIDVPGKLSEVDVYRVVDRLRKILGIELGSPRPVVATIVMRPPFSIDLGAIGLLGVRQGPRVKVVRSFYTALIFRKTVNIYAKLEGSIERVRYAILDLLPILCLCSTR